MSIYYNINYKPHLQKVKAKFQEQLPQWVKYKKYALARNQRVRGNPDDIAMIPLWLICKKGCEKCDRINSSDGSVYLWDKYRAIYRHIMRDHDVTDYLNFKLKIMF